MKRGSGTIAIICGAILMVIASSIDTTVGYNDIRIPSLDSMIKQLIWKLLAFVLITYGALLRFFGTEAKNDETTDDAYLSQIVRVENKILRHINSSLLYILKRIDGGKETSENLDRAYFKQFMPVENMILRHINSSILYVKLNIAFILSFAEILMLTLVTMISYLTYQSFQESKSQTTEDERSVVDANQSYERFSKIRNPELENIFTTGNVFKFQIGDANLLELSKAMQNPSTADFQRNYQLTCIGSQCNEFTKGTGLAEKVQSVSFHYCTSSKIAGTFSFAANSNDFVLTGVSISFGNEATNLEIVKMLDFFGVTARGKSALHNPEISNSQMGVGLFWKSGATGKDLCKYF